MNITALQPGYYKVRSETDPDSHYFVDLTQKPPFCSCPARVRCKHINAVVELAGKEHVSPADQTVAALRGFAGRGVAAQKDVDRILKEHEEGA